MRFISFLFSFFHLLLRSLDLKILAWLLVLSLYGCSSVKPMRGNEGIPLSGEIKPEVKISARYDKDLSQESYHLIEVYFLNLQDHWQRIKKVRVVELPGIEEFHVIQDNDLVTWKKSMLLDFNLKVEEAKKKKIVSPSPEIKERLIGLSSENALFAELSLPGKLQVERWVLIQTPGKQKINEMIIEVTFIDSVVTKYRLLVEGTSI